MYILDKKIKNQLKLNKNIFKQKYNYGIKMLKNKNNTTKKHDKYGMLNQRFGLYL